MDHIRRSNFGIFFSVRRNEFFHLQSRRKLKINICLVPNCSTARRAGHFHSWWLPLTTGHVSFVFLLYRTEKRKKNSPSTGNPHNELFCSAALESSDSYRTNLLRRLEWMLLGIGRERDKRPSAICDLSSPPQLTVVKRKIFRRALSSAQHDMTCESIYSSRKINFISSPTTSIRMSREIALNSRLTRQICHETEFQWIHSSSPLIRGEFNQNPLVFLAATQKTFDVCRVKSFSDGIWLTMLMAWGWENLSTHCRTN